MMRLAVGLMSGTSMDGIDAAILETDGRTVTAPRGFRQIGYEPELRRRLGHLIGQITGSVGGDAAGMPGCGAGGDGDAGERNAVAQLLTDAHEAAVGALLAACQVPLCDVDVIGFPGHTVLHRPSDGVTCQLGDGARLATRLGCSVVSDFRSADVAAGGQGAPFASLYHAALAQGLPLPLAVLNLGGVGNVTFIDGLDADRGLLAFDTGPGNALIDDWVSERSGLPFDEDGRIAASGTADLERVATLMQHPYFRRPPPKSLDRQDFATHVAEAVDGLGVADGAATLTAFTAAAVAHAAEHLPARPCRWLVCGGGRHNRHMMARLAGTLDAPVDPVEAVGWDGDALEAQAFAYLAVRSLDGLPLSVPGTTGVPQPMTGGVLHRPPDAAG